MSPAVPGTLRVFNDCLLTRRATAMECYGAFAYREIDEQQVLLVFFRPTDFFSKYIDVTPTPKGVQTFIVVEQGVNMAFVVDNLESSVCFCLSKIAGFHVLMQLYGIRCC